MTSDRSPDPTHFDATGDVRTAISDSLVALLKNFYGRGPKKTKTYVHDDPVVCLLRGGFTRVEQTLFEGGHGDDVIRQPPSVADALVRHGVTVQSHRRSATRPLAGAT